MEEQDNFHFLLLVAFSLAASILKYSSTSSTGVSYFFSCFTRGFILGWCFICFKRSFIIWNWVRE